MICNNCFFISNLNFINTGTRIFHSSLDKILSVIIPYYSLNREIKSIQGRIKSDPAYVLNDKAIESIREAFLEGDRLFGEKLLKNLMQIPVEELRRVVFSCLENRHQEKQAQASLIHFLKLLDPHMLEEWIGLNTDAISNLIETQVLLKDYAINNNLLVRGKAIWKELSREVMYFTHRLIETCISITGLSEIFNDEQEIYSFRRERSSYEAQSKLEFYLLILGYPSLIFSSLFVLVGSAPLAMLLTGITIAATLISIPAYMRYGILCPKAVRGLNNLNQEIIEKKTPPPFVRSNVINRILEAFTAGKGVILTAAPGAGKTTVVRSLAELIVADKCKQLAANAQLFSMNANKLNGVGIETIELDGLGRIFKRHSKEFILFLDEIESIFKENNLSGKASDSLLTFHDNFPFVICATTTDQFETTIANEHAFNRRFVRIEIDPLEDHELTIALYELLHYLAPELHVDYDAIPYLIQKSHDYNSKTSQADASTALLKAVITKATHVSFPQLNSEISQLEEQIKRFNNKYPHDLPATLDEITEQKAIRQTLREKKAELEQKQREFKRLEKIEKQAFKLKQSIYQIAPEASQDLHSKKRKWLIKQAQYAVLSQFVQQKRQDFGLPTGINRDLIDSIIPEANQEIEIDLTF